MSRSHNLFAAAVVLAAGTLLAGCSGAAAPTAAPSTAAAACSPTSGVTVLVNYSDVLGEPNLTACAPLASGTESVADALKAVGVKTEGTAKYGDQVVCRVNGLPAADEPFTVPGHAEYTEACKDMAPEYAYWALWVKSGTKAWDYAAEGVATQQVKPGDSIGLVFTTGGKTPTPTAG